MEVRKEEVEEACGVALMHEFARDLPEGDVGEPGAALSRGAEAETGDCRGEAEESECDTRCVCLSSSPQSRPLITFFCL